MKIILLERRALSYIVDGGEKWKIQIVMSGLQQL